MAGKACSSSTSTSRCTQYRPAAAVSWSRAACPAVASPAPAAPPGSAPGPARPVPAARNRTRPPRRGPAGRAGPARRGPTSGAPEFRRPRRRAAAGDHRHPHVRRLPGRRRPAVVEIQVAVQVGQADRAEGVAGPAEGAGQQRAAATHQEGHGAAVDLVAGPGTAAPGWWPGPTASRAPRWRRPGPGRPAGHPGRRRPPRRPRRSAPRPAGRPGPVPCRTAGCRGQPR